MLMKVYGGTPTQSEETLCATCRHAHIVRGRRMEEEMIICGAMTLRSIRITFRVTECTDHIDNREPSFQELFDKAWVLRPATKRRPAGFVRGAEITEAATRRMLRHIDDDDE